MAGRRPDDRAARRRVRRPRSSAGRLGGTLLVGLALGAVAVGCAPARSAESTGEPAVCADVRRLADSTAPLLAGATADAALRQAVHDELRAVAAAAPGEVAAATATLETQLLADPGSPGVGPGPATTAPPGPGSGSTPGSGSGAPSGTSASPREVVTLWALDTCGLDPFQPRRPAPTGATAGATAVATRRHGGVLDWAAVRELAAGVHPGAGWLARDTQGTVADDPDLGVTVVVFGTDGGDEALEVCRDVRAAVVAGRPAGTAVRVRVRGALGQPGAATRPDGSCTPVADDVPAG